MTRRRATPAALAALAAALLAACSRPDELPDMALTQYAVTFEATGPSGDPNAATLHAVNTGRGTLAEPTAGIDYHQGSGWLDAFVGGGGGGPWTIVLQPHTAGLQPGTYRAAVTVTSASPSARPAQVDVTLTVPGPSYVVSAATLAFEAPAAGDPAPLAFEVTNGGRGTLPVPDVEVQYAGTTGWLTAAVNETSSGYTVTVAAREVPAMPSGIHAATLSLGSAVLGGVRRPVDVTFALRPQLVLSGSLGPFVPAPGQSVPLSQTFTVRNAGRGVLPAPTVSTASQGGGWLSAKVSGSVEPYTVVVTVDGYGALGEGDYDGLLFVMAPAATTPAPEPVTLRVGPPAMGVSGGVSWSAIGGCPLPHRKTVVVSNTGVGLLSSPTITIPGDASSWLRAEVIGARAPYQVVFSVIAPPPVAPGQSLGITAELRATGVVEVAQVPVSFALQAPSITGTRAGPSPLVIHAQAGTGDPPPGTLTIWTDGGCIPAPTLTYAYEPGDTGWLSWTVATSAQRHDLHLQATTAGMAPGTARQLSLYVSSVRSGENTPVFAATVPLTLENAALEPTGALSIARHGHAAVRLPDGRVLVTGGEHVTGSDYSPPDVLTSAEVYDPVGGRFETYPALGQRRARHGAAVLDDGRIVACGGSSLLSSAANLLDCEVSAGGAWAPLAILRRSHESPSIVQLPRGRVLVAGNHYGLEASYDVDVVDLASGEATFATGADGAERVTGTSAVKLAGGKILVAGAPGGVTWLHDPEVDRWTRTGASIGQPVGPTLVALPDGRALAMTTGFGPEFLHGAELFDPVTGTWSATGPTKHVYEAGNVAVLSTGKVVALNGSPFGAANFPEIEVLDPTSGTWRLVDGVALPSGRAGATVTRLADGKLLVVGGGRAGSSTAEVLTW